MRPLSIGLLVLAAMALLWVSGRRLLGFGQVAATHASPSADAGRLARLLRYHVVDGRGDYAGLSAQRDELERYVAALAHTGPRTTPDRFTDEPTRLAYYLNAYNALVLHAVLAHWPITSVHDVRGVIEPKAGFGFFYALGFDLDGETTNLYELENDVLRGFGDARIHAAINCASASCPVLRAAPFDAEELEHQLEDATRSFVDDPVHVRIEPDRVVLNPIFQWYGRDFEQHAAARLGSPGSGDLLDFVAHYLGDERRAQLQHAREARLPIVFSEYDWSLNAAP